MLRLSKSPPGNLLNKIMAYGFWDSFLVLAPVSIVFYSSFGLTMKQIMQLQAVFSFTLVCCQFPAGLLADRIGTEKLLVGGSFLRAIGFSIFLFSSTYIHFMFFIIFFAVGVSACTGAQISILYKHSEAISNGGRKTLKHFGRFNSFQLIGELISSIIGGYVASHSMQYLALLASISSWGPFLISLYFLQSNLRPTINKIEKTSALVRISIFVRDMRWLLKSLNVVTVLTFINAVGWLLLTYTVMWFIQTKWTEIGIPMEHFGYIWAAYCLFVSLGCLFIEVIEQSINLKMVLILNRAAVILGLMFIRYNNHILIIFSGLLFQVSRIFQILIMNQLNQSIPAHKRATIVSLTDSVFRIMFSLIAPFLGSCLDHKGLSYVFSFLLYLSIAFFLGCCLP